MERILLGRQMKEVDNYTINTIGIPSMVLMERAALGVTEAVEEIYKSGDRILVVCGTGNNGADGLAVYRMLMIKGYRAECVIIGDSHGGTEEFQRQRKIIKNCGYKYSRRETIEESLDVDLGNYNIIVDGIFGIGLSRNAEGMYAEVIDSINSAKIEEKNLKIISIDAPSGIDADTGKVMGTGVKADITVTFGKAKVGLVMYPGASYAGKLKIYDIGIPWAVYGMVLFDSRVSKYICEEIYSFEKSDVAEYLSPRIPYSHKGTYGKVLVIAGSKEYSGAAYLCESAAYKSGCGLVKVVTSRENKSMLTVMVPEGLYEFYGDEGVNRDKLKADIDWADAIVIGPGLGQSFNALNMLKTVLEEKEKPVIIDADGINLLSSNRELLNEIDDNMVLTPHLREMSRLMETTVSEIKSDMLEAVSRYKRSYKGTLVLKDARTVIAGPKKEIFINTSGNSGMATGGSGDVLAGILGGLIAQEPNFDIALKSMTGVYLHGLAGDKAAEQLGEYAMTASNIVDGLAEVLKEYERY
ncbi:MAG: NAD(P)H-hydrate dehydratase [Lachnospiraceae bacterium]